MQIGIQRRREGKDGVWEQKFEYIQDVKFETPNDIPALTSLTKVKMAKKLQGSTILHVARQREE